MVAVLPYLIFAAAGLVAFYAIVAGWFEARSRVFALIASQRLHERRSLVRLYRARPSYSAQFAHHHF